jgi:hypothetical protein
MAFDNNILLLFAFALIRAKIKQESAEQCFASSDVDKNQSAPFPAGHGLLAKCFLAKMLRM